MKIVDVLKYLCVVVILIFTGFLGIIGIYADFLWFESLGFSSVFMTILSSRFLIGFAAFIFFFLVLYLNWRIVKRVLSKENPQFDENSGKMVPYLIAFIAFMAGISFSSQWSIVLKFFNASSFGTIDPIFGKDIGFFVFSLPFIKSIIGLLMGVSLLSLVGSLFAYLIYVKPTGNEAGDFRDFRDLSNVMYNLADLKKKAKAHLSTITGIFFIILGFWIWFSRYDILFSERGAVFGAAYTDIHITLPLLTILSVVSGIVGILFILEWKIDNLKYPSMGVGALIAIFVVGTILGSAVQQFQVEPDEFNTEKPFIKRNVEYTLKGFNLDGVE